MCRYAGLLKENPLDLCCLGIGENGHLAFNDPPDADLSDPSDLRVVTLEESCRLQQVNEGHFPEVSAVPRQAITVTVPALLRADRVIAVVPEARKAEPVLRGPQRSRVVRLPGIGVTHQARRDAPSRPGIRIPPWDLNGISATLTGENYLKELAANQALGK